MNLVKCTTASYYAPDGRRKKARNLNIFDNCCLVFPLLINKHLKVETKVKRIRAK